MQGTDILGLYREMRDAIDAIRGTMTAIETELALLQIYGQQEAIPRGLFRIKELAEHSARLETTFESCVRRREDGSVTCD